MIGDRPPPLVSIIVPIFNTEKYIERCLTSIMKQSLSAIEIICVDDVSPDQSVKVVERLKNDDPRIRLVRHNENLGLGGARNSGILAASARYVIGIDSDDYVSEFMVELLYEYAEKHGCDAVECGYQEVDEQGTELGRYAPDTSLREMDSAQNIFFVTRYAFWNKIWRKSLFTDNEIFFPNKLYYEDLATTPRLLAKMSRVGYISDLLYSYVQRPGSITNSVSDKHVLDYVRVFDILREFLHKNGLFHLQRENFESLISLNLEFITKKILQSDPANKRMCTYAGLLFQGYLQGLGSSGGPEKRSLPPAPARLPTESRSSSVVVDVRPVQRAICVVASRYDDGEIVMRMKIGAIQKHLRGVFEFQKLRSVNHVANCLIINHLDSADDSEGAIRSLVENNPKAVVLAFVSDLYPRVVSQIYKWSETIDAFIVPTDEIMRQMKTYTDNVFVISDPIDFCFEHSFEKRHFRKETLDVLWFGYPESYWKSMKEFDPLLRWMHGAKLIRYHIVTETAQFGTPKENCIISRYDPATFPMLMTLFDVCVLSHVPSDFSVSTLWKSENKAVLSINRGVPVVASRTPAYHRLFTELGLEDYLFSSREELKVLIDKLKDENLRTSFLQKSQKKILEKYSGRAMASSFQELFVLVAARKKAQEV